MSVAVAEIPLFGVDGRRRGVFSLSVIEKLPFVEIIRNKRGVAKRAHVKSKLIPTMSAKGTSFRQPVSTGTVWALRGIRGSGRV